MKLSKDVKSFLYSFSILIIAGVAIAYLGLIPGLIATAGVGAAANGNV